MLIRLCLALAFLGATCMAQNALQLAHFKAKQQAAAALLAAKTTPPPKTGNPNIDYKWDPNLPIELEGYDLSNYPFYNGLPDDLLDPTIYNFTCGGDRIDGFYASVHHQCQVYHNCLFGQRYDFLCANYTVFSQKDFICQYVSLVDCKNSAKHFDRNEALYKTESTTTTTPKPFPRREVEIVYVDRPVFTRPNRPRPKRPFFSANKRPQSSQAPPRQAIDDNQAQEQPAGGRRPSNRRPTDVVYDEYDYTYPDYYYDDYDYYYDEPKTTTTTTTTPPPPPPRRQRPGGNRPRPNIRQGTNRVRRPGGNRPRPNIRQGTNRVQDDARPLEQDISPVNKDTLNNEPEVRRPLNRRRPGTRPNKPVVRNTTPADPFYDDYYDYDNIVAEEPSIPTTTAAPDLTTRRPTRPRISIRKPEPTNEDALLSGDQEPEVKKPINGRRPFRPAPEEASSVPRRSGSGSVVNARQPFRPAAEESSPREEVPARGSLGSERRRGPSFPSRRKPTTELEEEVLIEEAPPLAPGIEIAADDTIPEEAPVEEVEVASRRASPGRRVRVGGRQQRRPQRQSPAAYYYYDYEY